MDKFLTLSQGYETRIDASSFDYLNQWKWHVKINQNTGHKYAFRNLFIDGKRTARPMHWFLMPPNDGLVVDHINRDTLDNRRENLRYATSGQNRANSLINKTSKSPYKGVTKDIKNSEWTGKWCARINVDGARVTIGRFKTPEEASMAFNAKHKEVYGEYSP